MAKSWYPVIDYVTCIEGGTCATNCMHEVYDKAKALSPVVAHPESSCCCGCNDSAIETCAKTVLIEYLYLDLKTCDRCIGTDQILEETMLILAPALQLSGYITQLKKVEIATEEMAKQYHFFASPTIRVNGRDVFKTVQENSCDCCGEISGMDTNCRIFEYEGQMYEVPPKAMLAEAILKAVFGVIESTDTYSEYTLPKNLKNFFNGKTVKRGCYNGGNCK